MDQKKIGALLKALRKEKGLTQEQLAETLGVSGRTVSRWETGSNMPDLAVLVQLTDYYGVELREILDGERKSETMNLEVKETVLKVADYSNQEKQRLTKRMCALFILGAVGFTVFLALEILGVADCLANGAVAEFSLGLAYGIMLAGVLYTSGLMAKFRAFKMKLLGRSDRA